MIQYDYLIHSQFSGSIICSDGIWYTGLTPDPERSLGSFVAFTCPVCLVSFNLEHSSTFPGICDIDPLEKLQPVACQGKLDESLCT